LYAHLGYAQKNEAKLLESIVFKAYAGGVMIIQAKVDTISQPLNFIFDTGSSGISLDSATCSEFNIPTTATDTSVSGIAGTRKVSYVFNKKFTVGSLVTDSMNFYVNDYSILASVYGEKIDGIVGYSFISKYIFKVDFDSFKLDIFSPGKIKYETGSTTLRPSISRLVTTPLEIKEKDKYIKQFYFDTGAGLSLLLTDDFVTSNKFLLKRRKQVITQVQGLGGKKEMGLTVIKKVKIGPYIFKNVPTSIYTESGTTVFNDPVIGLIGNEILRRFNMVINYASGEINLKPNGNFYDHFDYAYTGLSLYTTGQKIFIDDIIPKSPAEKAGLQNGDVVLGIVPSFNADIQTYEKLLQKAKESIKILVSRDNKTFFVTLTPISIW
jgi:Aspartyl protease